MTHDVLMYLWGALGLIALLIVLGFAAYGAVMVWIFWGESKRLEGRPRRRP